MSRISWLTNSTESDFAGETGNIKFGSAERRNITARRVFSLLDRIIALRVES